MPKSRVRPRRYRPSALAHSAVRRIPRPRVEIDRGLAWYAIWSAARAERRVARRLSDAGLAAYVPLETVERVRRNRVVQDARPAVSRYVFVGLDAAHPQFDAVHEALEEWTNVWPVTLGRLLRSEEGPLRVPASSLQRLADALGSPLAGDLGFPRFGIGQRVSAADGPFLGIPGAIEEIRDRRVRVLLDMLGGRVPVEFDADQLEAA